MADAGSLWSVLVGGAVALAGVGLTTGVNAFLKRSELEEEKKKRRAAKFEELVEAVYAFDEWLDNKKDVTVFEKKAEIGKSPFAKVEAITAVYFPRFKDDVTAVKTTWRTYEVWIFQAAGHRIAGQLGQINNGLPQAFQPYSMARDTLLKKLSDFAAEEFQ